MIVEALPFLLLGSLIAALIGRYLKTELIERLMSVPAVGLLLASLAGLVFPLCECAIVPVARSLREKGLSPPLVFTFMISVPLINPVVIISTAYAFRGYPGMVIGRFLFGWIAVLMIGAILILLERRKPAPLLLKPVSGHHAHSLDHDHNHNHDHPHNHDHQGAYCPVCAAEEAAVGVGIGAPSASAEPGIITIIRKTGGEFFFMARFFLLGSVITAMAKTFIPLDFLLSVGSKPLLSVLLMMGMAFFLSVCSEADAFIARGFLPWFSGKSILAFLILGPMLDLKNTLLLFHSFPRKEVFRLISVILGVLALILVVI